MYPSQINTRDLQFGNFSQPGDSSRDFSQLQNAQFTQFEMSQVDSQNFFSQPDQLSNMSFPETQSQGRRRFVYEKSISKPSFGNNSQEKVTFNRSSSGLTTSVPTANLNSFKQQQQLNNFKARVKEKEERDILNGIASIVKECSEEVKMNIFSLKEAEQESAEVLTNAVHKLSTCVEENTFKILKAIQTKEELVIQNSSLQQQLQKKDEQIHQLLQQTSETSMKDNVTAMQDAMKAFLESQQAAAEQKLQKIIEAAKDQSQLMQEMRSCQKEGQDDNRKHLTDLKYTSQRQIQDMEKRFQNELTNLRDDFDRQKRDMESFCKNQMQSFFQKYVREVEQQMLKGMEHTGSIVKGCTTEFSRQQQSEIRGILHEHQKEMENNIVFQGSQNSDRLLKQTQEQNLAICSKMRQDIDEKLETLQACQQQLLVDYARQFKELKNAIITTESNRSLQTDVVPKKVQEQLNKLQKDHSDEIQKLKDKIDKEQMKGQTSDEKANKGNDPLTFRQPLENIQPPKSEESNKKIDAKSGNRPMGTLFANEANFVSPRPRTGTTWNCKTVFGRTNPSPVATVLPQRKAAPAFQPRQQENATQSHEQVDIQTRQLRSRKRDIEQRNDNRGQTSQIFDDIIENQGFSQGVKLLDLDTIPSDKKNKKKKIKKSNAKKQIMEDKLDYKCANKSELKIREYGNNISNQFQNQIQVGKVQPLALMCQQVNSLYDFHDESSPRQSQLLHARKSYQTQPCSKNSNSPTKSDLLMSTDTGSPNAVRSNCSPSLSVTEVFIRRRIRHDVKTPMIKGSQSSLGFSDFLSTPNLTGLFKERSMDRLENVRTQSTAVRRRAERRKLCDFDTKVIQTIQCSNKKSRLGKY